MLQQFSWGQFLIAAALLSMVWYLLVGLIYYKVELQAFFATGLNADVGFGKGSDAERLSGFEKVPGKDLRNGNVREQQVNALMGTAKLPIGVEVLSAAQVAFTAVGSEEDSRYEQVGLVADVLQELKLIFSSLAKSDGGKVEFFRLLESVKAEYGRIGGHPSIGKINVFVKENAPFHISLEELEDLWL